MHSPSFILPLLTVSMVLIASTVPAWAWRFQGIGVPTGATSSAATAVSPDGLTVVGTVMVDSFRREAFRWRRQEGYTFLGDLPGEDDASAAHDVSADGETVVGVGSTGGSTFNSAFRWTAATGITAFPGSSRDDVLQSATGISSDGSVFVGYGYRPGAGEAYRWTASGGLERLGGLPGGGAYRVALAVSADGSVVVGSAANEHGGDDAVRWTRDGRIQSLGTTTYRAEGVSADGKVIVGSRVGLGDGEAFRWTEETGAVGLGALPGHVRSDAEAVSADGAVVVGFSLARDADFPEAFIWDGPSGMRSVAAVLQETQGLQLDGWHLINAHDISADGTVVVGVGLNPSGRLEGWVAIVPEPGMLAPLIACLYWLTVKYRTTRYG